MMAHDLICLMRIEALRDSAHEAWRVVNGPDWPRTEGFLKAQGFQC